MAAAGAERAQQPDATRQPNELSQILDAMSASDPSTMSAQKEAQNVAPPAAVTISPIPNGGLQAWIQVLGAHLLFFNSW